ncbi:MAG: hypothetical protein WCG99_01245 [Candidatus Berkelbacteria bacterium]
MSKLQESNFIKMFGGRTFSSEEEMEAFVVAKLPSILEVGDGFVVQQDYATGTSGLHSKRADIVIKNSRGDILVVFELKRSYWLRFGDQRNNAKQQLMDYCQRFGAPYGVILSEKYCYIMAIHPDGACKQVSALPPIQEIQPRQAINFGPEINKAQRQISVSAEAASREIHQGIDDQARKALKKYTIIGITLVILFFAGLAVWTYQTKMFTCENIKGNMSMTNGQTSKIYHTRESNFYDKVKIDTAQGDKVFCSEADALNAGFRKAINK